MKEYNAMYKKIKNFIYHLFLIFISNLYLKQFINTPYNLYYQNEYVLICAVTAIVYFIKYYENISMSRRIVI